MQMLDTHTLLWHLTDNPKLSLATSEMIENVTMRRFWIIDLKGLMGRRGLCRSTNITRMVLFNKTG